MLIIPYKFTLNLRGRLNHPNMELWEYMPAEKWWHYYINGFRLAEPDWLNKPEFEPTSQSVLEKIKKEIKKRDGTRSRITLNYFYDVVISKNWNDFNITRMAGVLPNDPNLIKRVELYHIWEKTKRLPDNPRFRVFLVDSWCWPAGCEQWSKASRPTLIKGKLVMLGKKSRTLAVKEFDADLREDCYQITIGTSIIHDDEGGACSAGKVTTTVPRELITPFRNDVQMNETVEKAAQLAINI